MPVFPLRDHDTFTTHWRERILANEANYAWTIVADGEVAGHMLCFELDGKRAVGYWLGRVVLGTRHRDGRARPRCWAR